MRAEHGLPMGLAEHSRLGSAAYAAVWSGALLFASPYLIARAIAHPGEMRERFGGWGALPEAATGAIWVHAASMGEARAALPLLRALEARGRPTFVSVLTPAARDCERELTSAGARFVRFAPLDFAPLVAPLFRRLRPAALLILETEIWFALLRAAVSRNVPAAFVSARLTERGVRRSRRLRPLLRRVLARVAVAAQTESDRSRFCELGVSPDRSGVTGNIKYHSPRGPLAVEERGRLRNGWARVVVLGSVRTSDIDEVAKALASGREWARDTLWIVAPRHPQRSLSALQHALRPFASVRVRDRREEPLIPPVTDFTDRPDRMAVLLIATIGELTRFYGVADAAFVGGTFGHIGGHNLFEAAEVGVPVAFGPSVGNVADVAEVLVARGGGRQVADGDALARALREWIVYPDAAGAAGTAALLAAAHLGGAAARTLEALSEWGYPVA